MNEHGHSPVRRQCRAVRRPRRVRLTVRDSQILEALGKLRFATTRQLARLYFHSHSGTNKRLRKLFDARYVRAWVRSLSEENVYSLDRRCVEALEVDWVCPRGVDGNLDHLLAINDVRIALAVELPRLGGALSSWQSDWELRSHARARVVPDALFEVSWDDDRCQVCALEVDHASRSPRKLLLKILRYEAGRNIYGYRDPLVLVVCRDAALFDRYREALADYGRDRFWFTTLAGVAKLDAWQGCVGPDRYSLQDLVSLPYGKEARRGQERAKITRLESARSRESTPQ